MWRSVVTWARALNEEAMQTQSALTHAHIRHTQLFRESKERREDTLRCEARRGTARGGAVRERSVNDKRATFTTLQNDRVQKIPFIENKERSVNVRPKYEGTRSGTTLRTGKCLPKD